MTDDATASERYAASRLRARYPQLTEFEGLYPFGLDEFQIAACREIEDGRGVLVAAPTGSGKTVVGEFAIHLALAQGRKCFYTAPIKALSNQKYSELVERYGFDQVGLLTGDHTVNGEAPIVVMTTEVLRNMLYAGSTTLTGLGYVVMDEVHYLADRDRGAVWEEVIIHLPESVALVSLSATVSNAEEFGEWLQTVRGDTAIVVEEKRPVPLYQHVMVGRKVLDLFESSDVEAAAGFVREGTPVNEQLMRIARDDWASSRIRDRRAPKGQRRGHGNTKGGAGRAGAARSGAARGGGRGGERRDVGNGRRVWVPSRVDVIDQLERMSLLPAIVFIFSRAGCEAAVQQCLAARVRLTSDAEREAVLEFVEEQLAYLPAADRHVLGYHDFADALSRGVAAHHAGMLPAFKTVVETLFADGLIKVVFATETLALGINMPARTVVLEKLDKWNGETHAAITPGEYTQLTGRAGRRGLDVEGHGVVLWQPGFNPKELAGLASTRTFPLRSSFRPSYNMAVNLVAQFGRARARGLLELSFAQFQADQAVVGLTRQLQKAEDALAGYAEAAACEQGDFMEYAALRRRISDVEQDAARSRRHDRRDEAARSLELLKPGDLIHVPVGKFSGFAVVLDPGLGAGQEPRPLVLTENKVARRLAMMDFPVPIESLGRVRIPKSFSQRNPQMRRDLAVAVRTAAARVRVPDTSTQRKNSATARPSGVDLEIAELRDQLKAHPCHQCPDREDHSRWAERWFKLKRDSETLTRRVEARTNSVARTFDRVCSVLDALGYLDGDAVTERGQHLRRIYSELDLVAAESMRSGVWDALTPAQLAAVLSTLTYESRRDDGDAPRIPGGAVQVAITEMMRLWGQLANLEADHKLDFLRRPDPGFAWAAWRWAEGDDLDEVLDAVGMAAGDFVRAMKQLIDLAGQVADAAGTKELRSAARTVVSQLRRGVVDYSALND